MYQYKDLTGNLHRLVLYVHMRACVYMPEFKNKMTMADVSISNNPPTLSNQSHKNRRLRRQHIS